MTLFAGQLYTTGVVCVPGDQDEEWLIALAVQRHHIGVDYLWHFQGLMFIQNQADRSSGKAPASALTSMAIRWPTRWPS